MSSMTQAPGFNKSVYQGTHGNLSTVISTVQISAVPSGDTIQMIKMPPGTRVSTILVSSSSGLGADAGIDILVGDDVVASVDDFSAEGTHTRSGPLSLSQEAVVYSVKIKGGLTVAATGDLVMQLFYVSEGTL